MTTNEAITILEEVSLIDDSLYQYNEKYLEALEMAIQSLSAENTEELQPIIRGKCSITHGMYENRIWCNNCGFIKVITGEEKNYNFCPKCGAIVEE